MTVVLDTTVLVDLLRGHDGALRYLESLDDDAACSEITRLEVVRGLRSAERAPAERLFATLFWVAVDEAVSRLAGELGRRYRRSHPGMSSADLAVAATAGQLNAGLATANVRHFPMFGELRRPY